MSPAKATVPVDTVPLLREAMGVLGGGRQGFAALFSISLRTFARVMSGESSLSADQMRHLIACVQPKDAALAAELAATMGETLVSLGLVAPEPPQRAPDADVTAAVSKEPAAGASSGRPTRYEIDAIVCASADAANTTPKRARAGLLAALERARELGVSVDSLEKMLIVADGRQAGAARPA